MSNYKPIEQESVWPVRCGCGQIAKYYVENPKGCVCIGCYAKQLAKESINRILDSREGKE